MLTITLSVLAVTVVVAWFLLVAKRRPRKAQATYNEHSVPTADDNAKALAERLALDVALFPELQPNAAELTERQAIDAAVRQELEQCSDADLDDIAQGPIFMFKADCDPAFRARVTTRQRVARELLAERAYQPGSVTIACGRRPYTAGDKRFD